MVRDLFALRLRLRRIAGHEEMPMIAERPDRVRVERSDAPALTEAGEAGSHQTKSCLAAGDDGPGELVLREEGLQVLNAGGANGVVMDFIETIHDQQNAAFLE